MRNVLLFILFWLSIPVYADQFYKIVQYECDEKNNFIAIHFKGAYNEAGELLMKNKGKNGVDPGSLIELDSSGSRIENTKLVTKICKLSDGEYKVHIGPEPGNTNILGRCGAFISAWVSIGKDNIQLFRTNFESDCHDFDSMVITKVLWRPGFKKAEINEIHKDKFYQ